jgi:hypothetical protein
MTEHAGIRFRDGGFIPADEPLARWITIVAMALNDAVLVNGWLIPRLQGDDAPAHENVYLGRLAASHLYEVAKFLHQSERRFQEVRDFLAELDEESCTVYERVKAAGPAGSDAFASQLEHARHVFFHYAELVPQAPDHEKLRLAMVEHAETTGEIYDPGTLADFRARFADDIAVELSFPDESVNLREFIGELSSRVSDFLDFARAAILAYAEGRPEDQWEYIPAEEAPRAEESAGQ